MPIGLYRITPPPERLARGQLVIACMADSSMAAMALERGYVAPGLCLGHTEPLIKPVAAVPGDIVTISSGGIAVNGMPLANTAPLSADLAGRSLSPFPAGEYQVPPDHVWLVANSIPDSFDARYYGSVPISSVQGIATSLWTWR